MAINVGVGSSQNADSYGAGFSACRGAIEVMGGAMPDLIIVFASSLFNQTEIVRGIREASGFAPVVGCSTAGEIIQGNISQKSVAVMALKSDSVKFTAAIAREVSVSPREAARSVAQLIKEKDPNIRLLLALPDILDSNGMEIVRGIIDVLGRHFPIAGGCPADDYLFQKTYNYFNDEVVSDAIVAVGMSGSFSMGMGVQHGWIPIGIPVKVTKSEGAIIHELDNKPAISIYEDYFGKKLDNFKTESLIKTSLVYPLGFQVSDEKEYLIRTPLKVDERGSITCTAEIPQGSEVRLMIGSKDRALEAAERAIQMMTKEFEREEKKPKFVLIFASAARKKIYGDLSKTIIDRFTSMIGQGVPTLGFYTYGELAPIDGEVRDLLNIKPTFFNQTVVFLAIGD